MKTTEDINRTSDNDNAVVAGIFFVYMSLILLGVVYGVYQHDSYELVMGHKAISETTGEDFGVVIARAKEMDGHCEYRACDEKNKTCDWYDNSNHECDGMNKGDWIAKTENKIYQGTSLCSTTKGDFAKIGNPSQDRGANCWCRSGKNWVAHVFFNNSYYCSNNGCAGNCAHGVLYSPAFRSAINAKSQKTK